MTIGIYSLYWEEQDLIYIGQSQNIEKRFSTHINTMTKNSHHNYKVQDTYIKYGRPILSILEACSTLDLNNKEAYWITEFSALNPMFGLNIAEVGENTYGTKAISAKYSKVKILRIFSRLCRSTLTNESIATLEGVSSSLVRRISTGKLHVWLEEEYPFIYPLILRRVSIRVTKYSSHLGTNYLISPTGERVKVTSATVLAKSRHEFTDNVLASAKGISAILSGNRLSYKGWRLSSD